MKKGIHPAYKVIEVKMTDGSIFHTRSCYKSNNMVLEIDSKSQTLVDTAGRVDRFKKRFEKAQMLRKGGDNV